MKWMQRIVSFFVFLFISTTLNAAMHKQPIKLYMAAALFNGREARFNLDLVDRLESKHYQVLFPQRDGFEYIALREAVAKYLPADKVVSAVRDFIYLLDMGVFVPSCDVVIANLDEPLDEGVIVEMTYAHLMGKTVIGYRTDLRTPFGNAEGLGGLHSFVAYQCDYLIRLHMPIKNDMDANNLLIELVDRIDDTIKSLNVKPGKPLPSYANDNPDILKILTNAKLIFGDKQDIHTKSGLETVIKRLVANQDKVKQLKFDVSVM